MCVYFYSLRVSGSHVSNHQENYCINVTSGLYHSETCDWFKIYKKVLFKMNGVDYR